MTYFVETKDGHFFRSTAIIRIEQSRRDDNICEAWSTAAMIPAATSSACRQRANAAYHRGRSARGRAASMTAFLDHYALHH